MGRKSRRLTPEERELWQRVALTAAPLRPPEAPQTAPLELPKAAQAPMRDMPLPAPQNLRAFRIGEAAKGPPASRIDRASVLAHTPSVTPKMDRKTHRAMTRGKLRPEGRIDLHGMTLAEARPALTGFLLDATARGKRLLLVITGKGRVGAADSGPIPIRPGLLRHQVPAWLVQPPLGGVVLDIAAAHPSHGGGGAYYVYLRRQASG